jgi:hypothetical protein
MSFKFAKVDEEGQQQRGQNSKKQLEYSSGQFAFFDIGDVYNDPEGPVFTKMKLQIRKERVKIQVTKYTVVAQRSYSMRRVGKLARFYIF